MSKNKKIVCLGGGNAMPSAVLQGLKKYPVNLSAVCAMLDSGGSAGREREIYRTNVSFGDIRRAFLALSESSPGVIETFNIRFKEGPYQGMVVANIFGTAVVKETGDYEKAFEVYREILKVPEQYQVFPSTLDDRHLCAVLENDQVICGEADIDAPKHDGNLKIKEVSLKPLEPKAKAYPKAVEEIKKADLIVMGPGDLYSSIIQILLVDGIAEAIRESKAKKIYICNLMTKNGETNGFSVKDFSGEIEKYLKGKVDRVVYNSVKPDEKRLADYKKEHPEFLELVEADKDLDKDKFIGKDLLAKEGALVHDPDKLAKIILNF